MGSKTKKPAQKETQRGRPKDLSKKPDQLLGDAFEGITGRQPKSDDELNRWLATDEGKEATLFACTTLSPWGERGRS